MRYKQPAKKENLKLSDVLRRISKYFGHWEVGIISFRNLNPQAGAVIFSSYQFCVIIKNKVQSKEITN